MKNRDVYSKDPSTWKLVNEGVATVNDTTTDEAMAVLRYELETFVCEGQYEAGFKHVLETYLKNLHQAQQPAVWISGFFGSGKSHLVKMMRALWVDTPFPDGATARGVATLPESVTDALKELSVEGKRHGGLHAASGTLGASADGSVRLALLSIIFRSAGLPAQYPVAQFVMWLRKEGLYDSVRVLVEKKGYDWQEELDNLHVAEGLYEALCEAKPNIFSPTSSAVEVMTQLYPNVADVSSEDMLKAIRQALSQKAQFPLTLVVLDEIQQFIGEDGRRSEEVREMVEACCKSEMGSKILFIGTGQTAVTGTANLRKQEGRFTVRVELSDADVDSVIRKVIISKKTEAIPVIEGEMTRNIGEISRHLQGTTLAHQQSDTKYFTQDYPILPTRRRFWEATQRVLDQTGTDSQLRSMLSIVHKVAQTNLDREVPHVIPADYLYFDSADKLLQSRILPRKLHENTMTWIKGSEDQQLLARACGLVFLINKLAASNTEIGISATVDTLADLLVENIAEGSAPIRSRLPGLLDDCKLLMKIEDEYKIQTEESQAWNDDFLAEKGRLNNQAHRIEAERDDRIRNRFGETVGKLNDQHGDSKVNRSFSPVFDGSLPPDADQKICVWVRDGWNADENTVRAEARQAGNHSPTVFVFIPKRSSDDLRHQMIDYKAATAVLEKRGVPNSPEGKEARAALETAQGNANKRISALLDDCFSGARVFQGGGNEVIGNNLQATVLEAARNSLARLYPQFDQADHAAWDKVYAKAKAGAPDALKAVGDDGEPSQNPVCKAILSQIGGGKSGADIRVHFDSAPYGWSQDAVDGGLQVLLNSGHIRAQNDHGQPLDPKDLERKAIGKTTFKVESATVSAPQRIQIRKVMQKVGMSNIKQGEELIKVPEFLQKLLDLAHRAGGDPPQPLRPNTETIEGIRLMQGNEQLLAIFNARDELTTNINDWQAAAAKIQQRLPLWQKLERLLEHTQGLEDAEALQAQADQIKAQRHLLQDPDPITPLTSNVTQLLREKLNELKKSYDERYQQGFAKLESDATWSSLTPDEKHGILLPQNLTEATQPKVELSDQSAILQTLSGISVSALADRVAALPARFDQALQEAAKIKEPTAQVVYLQNATLKTEEEIDAWVEKTRGQLKKALNDGPIIVR
ncbi:MAG: BREX system P-loop protein BrxC [Opitutales bacterium]|nr:BREX system P-loop protein BrxC [Opitutales bacterium]